MEVRDLPGRRCLLAESDGLRHSGRGTKRRMGQSTVAGVFGSAPVMACGRQLHSSSCQAQAAGRARRAAPDGAAVVSAAAARRQQRVGRRADYERRSGGSAESDHRLLPRVGRGPRAAGRARPHERRAGTTGSGDLRAGAAQGTGGTRPIARPRACSWTTSCTRENSTCAISSRSRTGNWRNRKPGWRSPTRSWAELAAAIQFVAESEGLSLVLNKNNPSLLFFVKEIDVTDLVIAELGSRARRN